MRYPLSHWRAWLLRCFIAFLTTVTVTAAGVGAAYKYAERKIDEIDEAVIKPGILDYGDPGGPANFLVVGSDSRSFVDSDIEEQQFGTDNMGERSDTMMIVHIDPKSKTTLVVSLPRDLWVEIPGHKDAKLNSAFAGGPERLIETVQANFDIPIHHYLEVDFTGFSQIVDSVGGVDVYMPAPVRDKKTGLLVLWTELPCVHLDGLRSLQYVRSRYYESMEDGTWRTDPTSDLGRMDRQQDFMRRLARAGIAKVTHSPGKIPEIVTKAIAPLSMDKDLKSDLERIFALVYAFKSSDPAAMETITLPIKSGPRQGGQSVLYLDEEKAEAVFARLRQLTPPPALPDVSPNEVEVRVLNGSGEAGIAGAVIADLQDLGFQGTEVGDADNHDYDTTEIRYAKGAHDEALLVQVYANGVGTLIEDSSIAASGTEVVLIVGKDFNGITNPNAAALATTTTPPSSSDSGSGATTPPASATVPDSAAPDSGGDAPQVGPPPAPPC